MKKCLNWKLKNFLNLLFLLWLCVGCSIFPVKISYGMYKATDDLPSEVIRDLPPDINEQVNYFLNYFTHEKKEVVQRWLERCALFLPYFKVIFKEFGIPEDIVYLAYIESGCNPFATSPAGAVGIWQFMKTTAEMYGLKINDWIDERRDFIKSTYSAAKYLKNLYKKFGNWEMAIASYNIGEGKLIRILRARNFIDYWQIMNSYEIPEETKAYLPKWMAIILIAKNPQKYGFSRPKTEVINYDEIPVNGGIDLKVFSFAGEIDYQLILLLNAELINKITPPGVVYKLKIPFEKKKILQERLSSTRTVVKRKKFHKNKKIIEIVTLPEEETKISF